MDLTPLAPVLAVLFIGLPVLCYVSWIKPRPKGKYATYRRYMGSKEWKQKREMVFHYQGRRCQVCGRGESLQVHHNTYDRFGHESQGDLLVLCRDCHDLFTRFGRLRR